MAAPLPNPDPLLNTVHDLALACLSGKATPDQAALLEELVCGDPEARRIYANIIRDSIHLHRWAAAARLHCDEMSARNDPGAMARPSLISTVDALVADDSELETSECANHQTHFPSLGILGAPVQSTFGYLSSGWPVAYLVASVVLGVGLLVGSSVPVSEPEYVVKSSLPALPSGHSAPLEHQKHVGRITGMVDCVWEEAGTMGQRPGARGQEPEKTIHYPLSTNSPVAIGDRFALRSGLLEISYTIGAKVILQGPVTYEVDSAAGGYLAIGKLTARLEASGGRQSPVDKAVSDTRSLHKQEANAPRSPSTAPSPLFTISTPTAIVTDLGTEFGVEVDKLGATQSHVFRGSVELRAIASNRESNPVIRLLRANDTVRVERSNGDSQPRIVEIKASNASAGDFVRECPAHTVKHIDLVDAIGGGDGTSGIRDRGIDLTNGQPKTSRAKPALDVKDYINGDRKFHRGTLLPFIDGVFIPDGSRGPMQVDSAGHTFAEFPTTTNQTDGYLWVGGVIHTEPPFQPIPTVLDGVDYASGSHGILYLSSNQAVTFNLDAIRQKNNGYKVTRFRAMAGNTETASAKGQSACADIWVLVDGQVRFRRRQINAFNGAFPVVVPLSDNEHFLTLATTDGGDGIGWDWILFGDPQIELSTTKARQEIP
jgi:hypothetical protein